MSEWIRCAEQMPPENAPVLVYGIAANDPEDGGPMIAVYQFHRVSERCAWWGSVGDCGYEHEDSIKEPTHWMPLPEPPKEQPGGYA